MGVLDINVQSLSINKIRTMHASTGPSYLIINGGSSNNLVSKTMLTKLKLKKKILGRSPSKRGKVCMSG